jgi:hypothetical protein
LADKEPGQGKITRLSMAIYEFTIQSYTNEELEDGAPVAFQKQGWRVCGSIVIDPNSTWCGDKSIKIPFKRKIKNVKRQNLLQS